MWVERCRCNGLVRGLSCCLGLEWDQDRGLGCWFAGGGWTGWGRGPSLTAAHSEAAPNPIPSTRQVRVCPGLSCPADVRWQVVRMPKGRLAGNVRLHAVGAPKVSATSMSFSAGSCTRPRRRQGVCFVAASECAAVSEGHGAHPLTAAAPTSQPNQRPKQSNPTAQPDSKQQMKNIAYFVRK
jgi:hypothetical protein